ncbi:Mbov_0400 family ICE element protein [Mycoplasma sp. 'Moose RK']|uniref:Mbov_0400 family ICE element protein n=1 Tax=Mycoplasma sp. 'Moose RK' TaxID=2780095 RepID=UPI0018C32A2F|nr:hypothetical protein [Mycoplasma sp. 'Moose RK']MBG0730751.1 hypothetical protein [Mycoplasma sp. 'Moose RK']MBG0731043.1 hypothetical protein [Mycoplasma sp. 'Moose RK']
MAKKLIEKFTPTSFNDSLIFSSLEEPVDAHPVVVFYDSNTDLYYYVKARSKYKKNGEIRKKLKGEIEIPKVNKPKTLFRKDSYLDCSQIFYIDKDDLEKFLKKNQTKIWDTQELDYYYVNKIFNTINSFLNQRPPFVVLTQVDYDEKIQKATSKVLYASDWHLKKDYNNSSKSPEIKFKKEGLQKERDSQNLNLLRNNLSLAKKEYEEEKIHWPLLKWIKKNKFIQNGLNSMEIIKQYNSLEEPIIPINIDAKVITKSIIDYDKLTDELQKNDFEFMINWFVESNLSLDLDNFKIFKLIMQKDNNQIDVFDFNHLEFEFNDILKKIENERFKTSLVIQAEENLQKNTNQSNHSNSVWDKAKQKPEEEKDKNKKKLKMKM